MLLNPQVYQAPEIVIMKKYYKLGKKWVPTYATVAAHFTTIAQPFPIFRKLLAIISSMKNHPHLTILNQNINTNTKSLMLLTQLAL